jgi:hypothetical protein
MLATSAISANLNVYASGLKITGIEDNKVTISYFLNAPADEVLFLLLDGANPNENSPVHSVSLSGKTAGANSAVIDLSGYVGSHYTWAIKATSDEKVAEPTLVGGGVGSDERFNFYTPAGLAVDNNPNSPYFGRIYVTESRENITTAFGRTVQQGVYIYGADLSDITNQGLNPYVGGVDWNENTTNRVFFHELLHISVTHLEVIEIMGVHHHCLSDFFTDAQTFPRSIFCLEFKLFSRDRLRGNISIFRT